MIREIQLPALNVTETTVGDDGQWLIPGFTIPAKMISFDSDLAESLILAARGAHRSSYSPYSKFAVGSAVVMADDPDQTVFTGCNVENASYGATICAERNALSSAANAGFRKIKLIAVATIATADADLKDRSPCGPCRQVIREFATDETLILINRGGAETTVGGEVLDIDRLLPWGFKLD